MLAIEDDDELSHFMRPKMDIKNTVYNAGKSDVVASPKTISVSSCMEYSALKRPK